MPRNRLQNIITASGPMVCVIAMIALNACSSPAVTPPQFFQLNLVLEVGTEEAAIKYNWHCFSDSSISESDWKFHEHRHATHASEFVLLNIGTDGLLFFPSPSCQPTNDYYPKLTLARSVSNPVTVEFYDRQRTSLDGFTVRIKSSVVKQVAVDIGDSTPTPEQIRRIHELDANSRGFQMMEARIWSESAWRKFKNLSATLQDIDQYIVAPSEPRKSNVSVGYAWFPFSDVTAVPNELVTVPMRKIGSVWVMGPKEQNAALVGYTLNLPSEKIGKMHGFFNQPPSYIKYEGHDVLVNKLVQTYDPSKRVIIDFINDYREKPWVGPAVLPK